MSKVHSVRGVGLVALDAKPRGTGPVPQYSSERVEVLLSEAVDDGLRALIIREFCGFVEQALKWKVRADRAEKELARLTQVEAIYTMWRRGMNQRDIDAAGTMHVKNLSRGRAGLSERRSRTRHGFQNQRSISHPIGLNTSFNGLKFVT